MGEFLNKFFYQIIRSYIIGIIAVLIVIILNYSFPSYGFFSGISEEKFVVPGEHVISFDEKGEYLVCYEYQGFIDGEKYNINKHDELIIKIYNEDSLFVPVFKGMNYSYSDNETVGESIGVLDVKNESVYRIVLKYMSGDSIPKYNLAIIDRNEVTKSFIYMFIFIVLSILVSSITVFYLYRRYNIKWGIVNS